MSVRRKPRGFCLGLLWVILWGTPALAPGNPSSLLLSFEASEGLRARQRARILFFTLETRPMGTLPGNTVRETGVGYPIRCGDKTVLVMPSSIATRPASIRIQTESGDALSGQFLGTWEEEDLSFIQLIGDSIPTPLQLASSGVPGKTGLSLTGLFPGTPGVLTLVHQWEDPEGDWLSSLTLADGTWIFDKNGFLIAIPTAVSPDRKSTKLLIGTSVANFCKIRPLRLKIPGKTGEKARP